MRLLPVSEIAFVLFYPEVRYLERQRFGENLLRQLKRAIINSAN